MAKKVIDFSSVTTFFKRIFISGTHGKVRVRALVALILAILVGLYVFPTGWNRAADFLKEKTDSKISLPHLKESGFHLGLDLLGGTHLVYEADMSKIASKDQSEAIEGVRDVIERRINALGVSEPLVQTNFSGDAWRVIVDLAGIKNVSEAINQIGETPVLQFKEQSDKPMRQLTDAEKKDMQEYNKTALANADEIMAKANKGESFEDLAFKYSEDTGTREAKGDLGWFREGQLVTKFEDAVKALKDGELRRTPLQTEYGFHIIKRTETRTIQEEGENITEWRASHILVRTKSETDYMNMDDFWTDTELSGRQLERASVQFDPQTNMPEVSLQFNSDGVRLFKEITEKNVGKPVGIFLDGQAISIPTVNEAIRDGNARITGDFDLQEAKLLAQRLNAGALPVPVKLVSQETVGATLGSASVNKSLFAGLIGFALVVVLMILYYRLAGVMSVISLLVYAALTLAIFKFVPVTMTLAGIAGFILSMGMAVDANVLIFERLKEELAAGKDLEFSITESFNRAWPSIRDGNVTTLITSAILFWFSTSLIRGFALTLSLGILVSIFTAIVVTRIFMRSLASFIRNHKWIVG
ncbi:MAG: protein translocase subunit SecD [Patescibacteria group bacterium]